MPSVRRFERNLGSFLLRFVEKISMHPKEWRDVYKEYHVLHNIVGQ